MDNFITLLLNISYGLFYNLYYRALLGIKNYNKKDYLKIAISTAILATYLFVTSIFNFIEPLRSILALIILGGNIYAFDKEAKIPKFVAIALSFSITTVVWYVSMFIIYALAPLNVDDKLIHSISLVLSLVINLLALTFINRRNRSKHLNEPLIKRMYYLASVIVLAIHSYVRMNMQVEQGEKIDYLLYVILFAFAGWLVSFVKFLIKYRKKEYKLKTEKAQIKKAHDFLKEDNETLEKVVYEVEAENHTIVKLVPTIMETLNSALGAMSPEEIKGLTPEQKSKMQYLYRTYLGDIKTTTKQLQLNMELPKTAWDSLNDYFEKCNNRAIKENVSFRVNVYSDLHVLDKMGVPPLKTQEVIADHIDNAFKQIATMPDKQGVISVYFEKLKGIYQIRIEDNAHDFPVDILANLGRRGVTTNGTGHGFANTLKAIMLIDASLIIREYAPEHECTFNKSIILRFDGEHQFIIESYRSEKIKNANGLGNATIKHAKRVIDKKPESITENVLAVVSAQ